MTNEAPTKRARSRPADATEIFLAANQGEVKISGIIPGQEGTTFDHTGAKLVVLYRPATWGWESVEVPNTNMTMCLRAGMKVVCGDCGENCSPDPMVPTPNACKGRPKFATSRCPVCTRVFHDFESRKIPSHVALLAMQVPNEEDEETMLNQDAYTAATPALRLKVMSDDHIVKVHPGSAPMYGLRVPTSEELLGQARS